MRVTEVTVGQRPKRPCLASSDGGGAAEHRRLAATIADGVRPQANGLEYRSRLGARALRAQETADIRQTARFSVITCVRPVTVISREIDEDHRMRIAFYSHDSYGLGHLRRCLKIATSISERIPDVQGLLITGSPWTPLFRPPKGFGYFRLLPVVKIGPGQYEARTLGQDFEQTINARRAGIERALQQFRPDLFVVDNVPCGLAGELLPILEKIRRAGSPRLVLSLRDIVDGEAAVREQWAQVGAYDVLDHCYDETWVFGEREQFDPCSSYGFSPAAAARVVFCGHVGAPQRPRQPSRREPRRRPLVLVTGGGGGDAARVVRSYTAALERVRVRPNTQIALGPDFPQSEVPRNALANDIHISRFCSDLPAALAQADAVVSMAGYNTTCEILETGAAAILVPRVWPREEQWLRASALARSGHAQCIHPDDLTSNSLWQAVERSIEEPPPPWSGRRGAHIAAERSARLLEANRVAG